MTAILAFVFSPIGRWIAGVGVVLLMLTGIYVKGRFDGRASYKAKIERQINQAIEKGDVDFFTSVPRLGKKNAQKIIIQLRSKLTGTTGNLPGETSSETTEISDPLRAMGFDRQEIKTVLPKLPNGTIQVKIREALKLLGSA